MVSAMRVVLRFAVLISYLAALAYGYSEEADFAALNATFGERLHPFSTGKSWAICMSAFKNITTLSNTVSADYGKLINDSLKALAATGGGSVLLGNGTFDFTAPIEVPTNTCIVGVGIGKTILRVKDKSWPYYPFKGVLYSSKSQNTSFVGFTLDGNQNNQYTAHPYYGYGRTGIYQERTDYSYLLNVKVFDHEGSGSTFAPISISISIFPLLDSNILTF